MVQLSLILHSNFFSAACLLIYLRDGSSLVCTNCAGYLIRGVTTSPPVSRVLNRKLHMIVCILYMRGKISLQVCRLRSGFMKEPVTARDCHYMSRSKSPEM